jgi:hypothetical protein
MSEQELKECLSECLDGLESALEALSSFNHDDCAINNCYDEIYDEINELYEKIRLRYEK